MFYYKILFSRIMAIDPVQRQSIVSFIWKILFTFLGFLSTMYFAHAVGADILGAYFLFVAYFNISRIVSDSGFGEAAIKRISEGEEPNEYFSTSLVLRSLVLGVVILALITFRSYFVDLNDAGVFIWLLLALFVSLPNGAIANGIAGCGKMGIHSTCVFINHVSRILIQVVAVFLGYGAGGLAGGFVAGMLASTIIELRFVDLHFVHFGWRHIKSLSVFSFWLFLTSGGVLVYSYADTIMIGYYLNNADVGVYRVVLQFTSFAALSTITLRGILWPKVSHWSMIGEKGLIEESLSRALTYSFILAVPILIGGILLGERMLYFFYGAVFATGYLAFVILLIVQVVNIFQFFFTMYLGALDRQKDAFKVTAVGASANIVINVLLIPVIGITGAAIATLVTMGINAILAWRVLSKVIIMRIQYDSFFNILKASAVMSLFLGAYRIIVPLSNVWLTLVPIVLGAGIYGILVLKFDRKIYDELKGIAMQMNVAWPEWL